MSNSSMHVHQNICHIGGKIPELDTCIYVDFMENIHIGIMVIDTISNSVLFQNKTAQEMLKDISLIRENISFASLILRDYQNNGADHSSHSDPKTIQIGERYIGYSVYRVGKSHLWVLLRDITDRKIIQEKNALLAVVVEAAEESISILDTEGCIQYVNPSFEIVSGYQKEEVLGKHFSLVKGTPTSNDSFNDMWQTVRKGERWHHRVVSAKKDNTLYEEVITAAPIKNAKDDIVNFVVIMHDVTEKVRLESIAAAVNNMNNLGYIFSGIRHEIGNPVNSIKVALSVLLNNIDTAPKENVRRYVERSLAEILRIEDLLKCLRNFNMYEHPSIQDIDAGQFVDKFISLVREDFKNDGIEIKTILHPEARTICADPRALNQILLNIFRNSADALNDTEDPKIVLQVFQVRDSVVMRVVDNGCGMNDEEQQNLFRPFYTTKNTGTGLGLIIVRNMLSQMNCSLEITSEKNAGTIVDIYLPITRSQN